MRPTVNLFFLNLHFGSALGFAIGNFVCGSTEGSLLQIMRLGGRWYWDVLYIHAIAKRFRG